MKRYADADNDDDDVADDNRGFKGGVWAGF